MIHSVKRMEFIFIRKSEKKFFLTGAGKLQSKQLFLKLKFRPALLHIYLH